jgi:hypothetical protein
MKIKELINILNKHPEDANIIFEDKFIYDVFEYIPTYSVELINNTLYIEIEEI